MGEVDVHVTGERRGEEVLESDGAESLRIVVHLCGRDNLLRVRVVVERLQREVVALGIRGAAAHGHRNRRVARGHEVHEDRVAAVAVQAERIDADLVRRVLRQAHDGVGEVGGGVLV